MRYRKSYKYFVRLILFLIITYVCVVFHVDYNLDPTEYDQLYDGLKEIDQKEESFTKFLSSGERVW